MAILGCVLEDKIIENLYYGSRLEYLSFDAKIAFMAALCWELSLIFFVTQFF